MFLQVLCQSFLLKMEIKSQGVLRILPSREVKTEMQVSVNEILIKSAEESKNYRCDKIFSKSHTNEEIWDYFARGRHNLVSLLTSGVSSSLITYGEVNTGKTYSLFGKESGSDLFSNIISEIFQQHSGNLGVSIWEILYCGSERTEEVIDLLKISDFKPLPHTLTQDFISVEVSNTKEAEYVLDCAKELSSNWKGKNNEGGFRCLNNRSHFFVRIVLGQSFICLVDLAGALPMNLCPEVRVKLGSDEQLNYTRIGLNQFRSIVWEMSKNSEVSVEVLTASRKSKLALVISPILTMGKNIFFTTVKEESIYEDVMKNLDVLIRAQAIKVCPKNAKIIRKMIPLTVFTQRHKVAKYWEFKKDCEIVEENPGTKENSHKVTRSCLKDQISQMINELDESYVKKEPQNTVVYNSFELPFSKIETSFVREKEDLHENEMQEMKTTYELEMENIKLENLGLRQKLRSIQESSSLTGIFNIYEDEIRKLEAAVKSLREDHISNLASIEKNIDLVNNSTDEMSILQVKHKKSIKDLTSYIKSLESNLLITEKESSELKKNERRWQMSKKCFENVTRKSVVLETVVGKQTKFLQSNENTFQEMIDELEKLNKEVDCLKKALENSVQTNDYLSEELKIMKDIASTSGMPEETLKRIHKNLQSPQSIQGDFALNLILRLQKETADKKQSIFLDNIIHEVQSLTTSLENSQIREKNLIEILIELQKKLDNNSDFSKETNKALRKTLISQLTS